MLKKGDFVCIFTGSSLPKDTSIVDAAVLLSKGIAERGYGLVYGGGNSGLMGIVSSGVGKNGGKVVGVIPRALIKKEAPESAEKVEMETIIVHDMHARKRKFLEYGKAFVILPGGVGTFEEFLEFTTWSVLGIHDKPIVVLNTNGFYNPMKEMLKNAVDMGFLSSGNSSVIVFVDTPEEVLDCIETYVAPTSRYKLDWSDMRKEHFV
ncbi:hypothetical protein BB560_003868 [Smittium megazygosporum]|uniref:Cytokinin riboside 5'-monophosphate phosphoribohydrolase n=1 Tax=Smittium megazygosporum TaxID=133381 RepID=A0A2T9ZAU6_9FUNG|nr:hypothetical protein BB560_005568 [Smittium megazygosporum]PVV01702.1 hypothetical protein BB560_003868 [Smittium megazygosporum]